VAELYLALLHHPVYDKHRAVVTTAVTNLDVHDIARVARTFDVRGYFVCTPVPTLRRLVDRIIRHWEVGPGAAYNPTRKAALALVRQVPALDDALAEIERDTGCLPFVVATTARDAPGRLTHAMLRQRVSAAGPPVLLVFGTGWGLTDELIARCDAVLEPIRGVGEYNHLPVRAAVAIVLDRIRHGR
jgi:hypothetical protein